MNHNSHFLDFGVETKVIFTGVKTGKSSFLHSKTSGIYDEYYGSNSVEILNWKIVEQDSIIIDDQSPCVCHHLRSAALCYKESYCLYPMIILGATNKACWLSSFESVAIYPNKFYTSKEWIRLIKSNIYISKEIAEEDYEPLIESDDEITPAD